jgi:hypothetical protein
VFVLATPAILQSLWAAFFSFNARAESCLAAWRLLVMQIMEMVLGFFSHQDEDMLDACPYRSSGSVTFWKALLVSPLSALCQEFARSDGIWSCVHVFFI